MNRTEWLNRAFAFLGGTICVLVALSASPLVRESVVTVLLLVGLVLIMAAVAGEVRFQVRANGESSKSLTLQTRASKTAETVGKAVRKAKGLAKGKAKR